MTSAKPTSPRHSEGRLESFRHAFTGWATLVSGTPNARIHLLIASAVIALGLWLGLNLSEWAILWTMIGLVFTAEFLNSALEASVDLVSQELHPLAKSAKDMAAGGVLFAACTAVIVGLLILGPPLIARIGLISAR